MPIDIRKNALNVKNGDTYDNFDMFYLGDVGSAVGDWFEEHPEAVTNVADNSITSQKLAPSVREDIAELESAFETVPYRTSNLFKMNVFTDNGIPVENNEVSCTGIVINTLFNQNGIPLEINFEEGKVYTFSLYCYNSGGSFTNNNGLRFGFRYSDDSTGTTVIKNTVDSYTKYSVSSNPNKTIKNIYFTVNNGTSNTWRIKDIQLNEGLNKEYQPYYSFVDYYLRNLFSLSFDSFSLSGDGVTDDTIALTNYIKNNNKVFLRKGTYLISSTIPIDHDIHIIGDDGATILLNSQDETTYIFSCHGRINIKVENITFLSTYDKPDASWFERSTDSIYSNVRAFEVYSCKSFIVKNCEIKYLEMFAEINSENNVKNDYVYFDGIKTIYTQMFMHCASTKRLIIQNCNIDHQNSSRLDHTFYLAQYNENIYLNNIISKGCVGIPFSLASVDGYAETFNNAYISNCSMSARNGGLYIMYGNAIVYNCVINCTGSDASAIRNKGGVLKVFNSTIVNAVYLFYSEEGSDANSNAIPETYIKNIISNTKMIEGHQGINNTGGKRIFNNCYFNIFSGLEYNKIIICENSSATYEIINCVFTKDDVENEETILFSEIGVSAKINSNDVGDGFNLYNGNGARVIACNNVTYHEKGNLVGDDGIFQGNVVLS